MVRGSITGLSALLALSACSQSGNESDASQKMTTVDVAEQVPVAAPPRAEAIAHQSGGSAGPAPVAIPVSVPKIAYVFEYGYRLTADRIADLQRKHADLCERQGVQVCRILDMRQSGAEGAYGSGSLSLAVAAPRARSFGAELGKAAGDAGGEEVSSSISGEDLSKQIVDTEARLRARTVLRDRLMEVLATRKGTVAELVEAERGVAQVNEEIDQARSWLAEMQGRVDFTRVNIAYTSGGPSRGGFMEPVRSAVGSLGTILGTIFAAIIVALAILVPLGAIGWTGWAAVRKARGLPVRHRSAKPDRNPES